LITLKHTPQSVELLLRTDRPVADFYLITQTLYKRQTSMPPGAGIESTNPASAQPQTYALERAAPGIGFVVYEEQIYFTIE
jgi:hypothetical protein